jgi:hypothetical protein
MSGQMPDKDKLEIKSHYWLSPIFHTLTPQHAKIYQRYQILRIFIDFSAAMCFVFGSILFLYANTGLSAGRLFLIGSVCFAVKPTIDLVRSFHLNKI